MSTNLRLSAELANALRREAARTGRSQQEIVREAVAHHLGLDRDVTEMQAAIDAGAVLAPTPYRDIVPHRTLRSAASTLDLLDRSDRL